MIEHFINDFDRHGKYTGFPCLGLEWQKMESPFLRKALGMQARQRGWVWDETRRIAGTQSLRPLDDRRSGGGATGIPMLGIMWAGWGACIGSGDLPATA